MKKLKANKWLVGGTLVGGLMGYFYWSEIGCLTGKCPLKSQWQTMVPYGMFMGYVVTSFIEDFFVKPQE